MVKKEFRFDVPKNTPEVFFRAARFWRDNEKAPAVFHERGVNYLHVKVREKTENTSCRASLLSFAFCLTKKDAFTKALLSLTPRLRYVSFTIVSRTRLPGCSSSRRREETPARL